MVAIDAIVLLHCLRESGQGGETAKDEGSQTHVEAGDSGGIEPSGLKPYIETLIVSH
jgi:hypothetical protein